MTPGHTIEHRLLSSVPTQLLIDETWRDSVASRRFDVEDPATGLIVAVVADADADSVSEARAHSARPSIRELHLGSCHSVMKIIWGNTLRSLCCGEDGRQAVAGNLLQNSVSGHGSEPVVTRSRRPPWTCCRRRSRGAV